MYKVQEKIKKQQLLNYHKMSETQTIDTQNELNKFVLESTCIMHSLLEDYCTVAAKLTATDEKIIRKRILTLANEKLQKAKEIYL